MIAICWTGFFSVLVYGQTLYCIGDAPRPWCAGYLPNIYSFVQDHYWNVGFLRYFTISQIPNFVLAAPMAVFSLWGIWTYCALDWRWVATLGLSHRQGSHALRRLPYFSRTLLPHVYLWALMLVYTVLCIHVQIINRLFMFMPVLCWFHAHIFYMNGGLANTRRSALLKGIHLCCLGTFSVISSILFFGFYPPA